MSRSAIAVATVDVQDDAADRAMELSTHVMSVTECLACRSTVTRRGHERCQTDSLVLSGFGVYAQKPDIQLVSEQRYEHTIFAAVVPSLRLFCLVSPCGASTLVNRERPTKPPEYFSVIPTTTTTTTTTL
jgi:hypothetical protein